MGCMDVGQQKCDGMLTIPVSAVVARIRTRTRGSGDSGGHQFHRDVIGMYVCPLAGCRQGVAVKDWVSDHPGMKVFRAAREALLCATLLNVSEGKGQGVAYQTTIVCGSDVTSPRACTSIRVAQAPQMA